MVFKMTHLTILNIPEIIRAVWQDMSSLPADYQKIQFSLCLQNTHFP